jgi:phenylacetate-CoA ligase
LKSDLYRGNLRDDGLAGPGFPENREEVAPMFAPFDPVALARTAIERVPAYREFLASTLGHIPEMRDPRDFTALPLTDKPSYVKAYPLESVCLDGTLRGKHVLCRSSGTSGKPFFWPQMPEQERYAPGWIRSDLEENLHISERSTLLVVALGLGSWISGELTTWALRTVAMDCPNLTLVSPGLDLEETAEILTEFSPRYDQTMIYGYPPFMKGILDRACALGADLEHLSVSMRLVGEGYSEAYREGINGMLGAEPGALGTVLSGYGATDFGSVGKETPLCAAIRRLCRERDLTETLFGEALPSVCQYDPSGIYLELQEEELVVSKYQAVPLIRYRTGDRCELVPFDLMMDRCRGAGTDPLRRLAEGGFDPETAPRLPFVLVRGRMDRGVVLCGANVPVGLVRDVLENHPVLREALSGNFQLHRGEDEALRPFLEVALERREGIEPLGAEETFRILSAELRTRSSELAAVGKAQGELPLRISFLEPGSLAANQKIKYIA